MSETWFDELRDIARRVSPKDSMTLLSLANELESDRTPDLAAARAEAERLRRAVEEVLDFATHGGDPLRAMVGLRQAIDPPEGPGIVEALDALRDAGGKDWDRVEDVEEYLGRDEEDSHETSPATLPDPVKLIVDRVEADVKYEEDRAVKWNRAVEDEDEFTTWFTVAEARAFLDAIRTIGTSVSERT
jgi:hypothetical protein